MQQFRYALLPCLGNFDRGEENSILAMDNASIHHTGQHTQADGRIMSTVEALAKSVGARVIFLSPYSPDFNPIEKFFANIKGQAKKDSLLFHVEDVRARVRRYAEAISEVVATNTFIASGLRKGFPKGVLDAHDKIDEETEEEVAGVDFQLIHTAHTANLALLLPI